MFNDFGSDLQEALLDPESDFIALLKKYEVESIPELASEIVDTQNEVENDTDGKFEGLVADIQELCLKLK